MKHLLIALLLFVASISFGQVTVSAGANYGLRLDNATSIFNYQAGFTATTSYGFLYGRLKAGIRADSYISNTLELPHVFTGVNVSYPIYKISSDENGENHYVTDNGQHKIIHAGHWLYG